MTMSETGRTHVTPTADVTRERIEIVERPRSGERIGVIVSGGNTNAVDFDPSGAVCRYGIVIEGESLRRHDT